jgi:predicted RNase H-like HicB family nuclease
MNKEYTAVIKQDGKWWLGWVEEVPGVNCQESSYDELLESLRVTLLRPWNSTNKRLLPQHAPIIHTAHWANL